MRLRTDLTCMGVNESNSNRHRIIINYCAPGESSDPCDGGNTMMGFSASSETFSTRVSAGSSRPITFCCAIEMTIEIVPIKK